jgi:hypothetical protein
MCFRCSVGSVYKSPAAHFRVSGHILPSERKRKGPGHKPVEICPDPSGIEDRDNHPTILVGRCNLVGELAHEKELHHL